VAERSVCARQGARRQRGDVDRVLRAGSEVTGNFSSNGGQKKLKKIFQVFFLQLLFFYTQNFLFNDGSLHIWMQQEL
jgi:hypothetical protein